MSFVRRRVVSFVACVCVAMVSARADSPPVRAVTVWRQGLLEAGPAKAGERPGLALQGLPEATPTVVELPGRRGGRGVVGGPDGTGLRFWYRPSWASVGSVNGKGPGEVVRLVGVGDADSKPEEGWWELTVSADGNFLGFASGSGAGKYAVQGRKIYLEAGIWAEVMLSVAPGRVALYLDQVPLVEVEVARVPGPGPEALRKGLRVGGRGARGAVDGLEVFDGPLDAVFVQQRGRSISAAPLEAEGGVELRWQGPLGRVIELERSDGGHTNWNVIASGAGLAGWRDTNAARGRAYDYRVSVNGNPTSLALTAGWRLPAREDRGVVLVLVDETLATDLGPDLNQLQRDLVADGWRVLVRSAARHDDATWSRNTNAIVRLRAGIQADWKATEGALRCVYLIGHVAIPYSGMRAEDTHTGRGDNHSGAWPADQYYADMDGTWLDVESGEAYLGPTRFPITQNVPGDGKFDTDWVGLDAKGEARLELSIGRVDFANLPVFGRGRSTELSLLKRYLAKVHRQRSGLMPVAARAVVGPYARAAVDGDLFPTAMGTGARLFGAEPEKVREGDLFAPPDEEPVAWGFQSGFGNIDRIRTNGPDLVTSGMLADGKRRPRVWFAMLLGSWFGDWALGEDNLLRAITAAPDYGLAAMWVRQANWRWDPLASGGTLGDAQRKTANEVLRYQDANRGTTRTLAILGDPTLRLHPLAPPRSLRGQKSGGALRLVWQDSRTNILGYRVFRSAAGWKGTHVAIDGGGTRRRDFTDANAPAGASYLVRAMELVTTGCGSYTNLGSGAFWSPVAR